MCSYHYLVRTAILQKGLESLKLVFCDNFPVERLSLEVFRNTNLGMVFKKLFAEILKLECLNSTRFPENLTIPFGSGASIKITTINFDLKHSIHV